VDERPKDPKLDEFMRVMRATARSQVWKDDAIDNTVPDVDMEVDGGDASEDDMQVIGGGPPFLKRDATKPDQATVDGGDSSTSPNQPSHIPQTDDDWLRSKTSKHLDQQSDDEDEDPPNPHHESNELDEDAQDSKVQTGKQEVPDPQPENMTEEEKIKKYRRLYVRNLPFDVTEDDLRAHFVTFGELEEVSWLPSRNSFTFLDES
jgi:multiple RNA-binding domain-containing protein 1